MLLTFVKCHLILLPATGHSENMLQEMIFILEKNELFVWFLGKTEQVICGNDKPIKRNPSLLCRTGTNFEILKLWWSLRRQRVPGAGKQTPLPLSANHRLSLFLHLVLLIICFQFGLPFSSFFPSSVVQNLAFRVFLFLSSFILHLAFRLWTLIQL